MACTYRSVFAKYLWMGSLAVTLSFRKEFSAHVELNVSVIYFVLSLETGNPKLILFKKIFV